MPTSTTITGIKIQVTNAIKEYVEKQFSPINKRYDPLSFSLSFKKVEHRFFINLHYKLRCTNIYMQADGDDFYSMINSLSKRLKIKLDRKLRKQTHSNKHQKIKLINEEDVGNL